MLSDNDKDFLKGVIIVGGLLFCVFLIFQYTQTKAEMEKEANLRKVAANIQENYNILKSKKDMSCFLIVEPNIETKKVNLYFDENMTMETCGEQIMQFTNYAMREPFTINLIESPQ